MYFILTKYRLIVRTNIDLSTASSLKILTDDPYYENTHEWTAMASGKNAYFDISETEIERRGTYKMQLIAVIDGVTRRSRDYFSVTFEKSIFQ